MIFVVAYFHVFNQLMMGLIKFRRGEGLDEVQSKAQALHFYWHERAAFQSVAVQVVDWHDDSKPLFSLLVSFCFLSVITFSNRRSAQIKKLIQQN